MRWGRHGCVTLISLTGSGYIGLYTLFPIIFPPIPEAVYLTKEKTHNISLYINTGGCHSSMD